MKVIEILQTHSLEEFFSKTFKTDNITVTQDGTVYLADRIYLIDDFGSFLEDVKENFEAWSEEFNATSRDFKTFLIDFLELYRIE